MNIFFFIVMKNKQNNTKKFHLFSHEKIIIFL